jgi:hypothetical protein
MEPATSRAIRSLEMSHRRLRPSPSWIGLTLILLVAAFGAFAAHGHDGDDHGMAMEMNHDEPEEVERIEGRQLCAFRPGVHNARECGTRAEVRPAPPLKGKMVMYEANSFTGAEPTEVQQRAADKMVASCTESIRKRGWGSIDKALADGFEPAWNDSVHYVNRKFVFDGEFMNCKKPEYLMYYDGPSGKILAGVMFVPHELEDEGPQLGGTLTRWHFHYWPAPRCLDRGILATGFAAFGECQDGDVVSFRSPEMIHVWLFDHPGGRFSSMMHLSDDTKEVMFREASTAP